jgi:glycogen debranching enzyme
MNRLKMIEQKLKAMEQDIELYYAGLPGFPRNFTRDSIISAMLMRDKEILRNQLTFSALKQGTKQDAYNGEEPGKIFHEYPGVHMNDHSTEYAACDTTALFIIGHHAYLGMTQDTSFKEAHKPNLVRAVEYIRNHLKDNLFVEDPSFSGAEKFALKVTYWKDSEIANRKNGEPTYPVSYFLNQAINIAAIRSASCLLDSKELSDLANDMSSKLRLFFNVKERQCYIAIDADGPIEGVSSDLGHALYYLEPGDLQEDEIVLIKDSMAELETPIGYLTLSPKIKDAVADSYHATTVWPFEQAIIHIGARKFGIESFCNVSEKVVSRLDTDPEIFKVNGDSIVKGGCDPQLWTIAAKRYFSTVIPAKK